MAEYLIQDTTLTAIADAIRTKSEKSDAIPVSDMSTEIMNIPVGGASLNYSIVGSTTQPSNPTENMIWVNTDVEIADHMFTATEPTSPIDGTVWVSVGTTSKVEFSVVKNTLVMIYPLYAKQYISGAWVDKQAKTYKENAWVSWWAEGTLYDNGVDDTDITGGWTSYAEAIDSGYSGKTATVFMGEDRMIITYNTGSSNYSSTNISTVNAIDVTGYSSARFKFVGASGSGWAKAYVTGASSNMFDIHMLDDAESVDVNLTALSADQKKSCKVGLLLWSNTKNHTITVEFSLVQLIK